MDESSPFHCLSCTCLFTWLGLIFFLLDIATDIWTVVSLYQEGTYVFMGLMIFILLGSSVLLQLFSWFCYFDSLDDLETKVENFARRHALIKTFHVLQFGVFLRYAGFLEISLYKKKTEKSPYQILEFQMLRLLEAFSESAPQIILMTTLILQKGELELFSGLKLLMSAASIASTLTSYHMAIRDIFGVENQISTGVYFLWNCLLIVPRVAALALFCSVLPYFITAHFLSWWMVLVLVAWSQKTDLMKGHREWLFRASVALIWYFSWFNVSKKCIKFKNGIYCGFMVLDMMLLLSFWGWKVTEYASCWTSMNPIIVIPTLLGSYVIGILVLMINYKWFYPNYEKNIDKLDEKIADFGKYVKGYSDNNTTDPVPGVLLRSRTMVTDFNF